MKQSIDISIIIVNFNTKDVTRACLESLKKWYTKKDSWEIIVVDNGSVDGSVEMLKEVKKNDDFFKSLTLMLQKENLGFARANNLGMKRAVGRYVLLLNSDTEVRANSIQMMQQFMDAHPRAGAATCRLELANGNMDPACHRGFPTPWASFAYLSGLEKLFPTSKLFSRYHMGYENMDIAHEVDCISGAFFLARKEAIDVVGLLDEEYFMYAEDIDWAYRFKKQRWEIWFNPEVSILHKKKVSGRNNLLRSRKVTTEIYFHQYNWLFYKKHYAATYGPLMTAMVNTIYSIRLFLLKRFSL